MLVRALRKCFHGSLYRPGQTFEWNGDPKALPDYMEPVAKGDENKSASRLLDEAKEAQQRSHDAAVASSAQGVIEKAKKDKPKPPKKTAPAQAPQLD